MKNIFLLFHSSNSPKAMENGVSKPWYLHKQGRFHGSKRVDGLISLTNILCLKFDA